MLPKNPKIYYFTGLNFPARIANRTTIMKTSEALNKLGANFILFVSQLSLPPDEIYKFYRVEHKFPIRVLDIKTSRRLRSLAYAKEYKKIFLREKPDLVYLREPKLTLFLHLLLGNRLKFIYELHNEGPDFISRMLHKYILPRAKSVVFITKIMEQVVLNKYPELEDKTTVAPMAFEPELFVGSADISKQEARKRLNLTPERPLVLYAGSTLDAWKGFNFFVDAAKLLLDVNFVVVGGNDGSISEWRNYATSNRINNIYFAGYLSDKEELFLYYKAADVLASTTSRAHDDTGDSPMKIFEYMASGRPIVAMSGVVVEETLKDGINSFLVKERSAKALADRIKFVLNHPDLAEGAAKQAKEDSEQYTWEKRAEKIVELINKINV